MSSRHAAPDAGFVGVGRMGTAMAERVLAAGMPLLVADPDPEATRPLADRGAIVCETAAEVAAKADVVCVVVNTDEQVLESCTSPGGVFAGAGDTTVVAIHATVAPSTLRQLADAAGPARDRLVDAPVSGVRGHLSVGDLAVMVGGEPAAFAQAHPVFARYGSLVTHLGPYGRGMDAKLALNALRYLNYLTMQDAGRLADATGIGPRLFELVEHTGTQLYMGDFRGATPLGEDLDRRRVNVATAKKDLLAALERAAELDLDLAWTRSALERVSTIWSLDDDGRELPRRQPS